MVNFAGRVDYSLDIREKENILDNMLLKLDTGLRQRVIEKYLEQNVGFIHMSEKRVGCIKYKIRGKEYLITYDGALFNKERLVGELIEAGVNFFEYTDEEIILNAFVYFGEEFVNKLNGNYAFAIFDKEKKELTLVRDRVGVKPLFFYQYDRGILFSSVVTSLILNPMVEKVLDDDGLREIFLIGPGRTPGYGFIKGIEEVLPGEIIVISEREFRRAKYFTLKAIEHTDNLDTTIEKTGYLLKKAIEDQIRVSKKPCVMLSGGLDSSLVAKITTDYLGEVDTYSVSYTDNERFFEKSKYQPSLDSEYIKIMQDYIASNHEDISIKSEELFKHLDTARYARGFAGMADIDSSMLLFAHKIKADNDIALSGECADEIFGGYPWYHDKSIVFGDYFPWTKSIDLRNRILKDGVLRNQKEYVDEKYKATIKEVEILDNENKLDFQMRKMFVLNFKWFMQTLIDRADRMSRFVGLDLRVPFCDYEIVDYLYNMPWKMKSLYNREKGILREIARDILPKEIVWRKKSPYPKTYNPVYFKLASKKVMKIINDKKSFLHEVINRDAIEKIIKAPNSIEDPWYGQLMRAPQMLSYLIQVEYFISKNKIKV